MTDFQSFVRTLPHFEPLRLFELTALHFETRAMEMDLTAM